MTFNAFYFEQNTEKLIVLHFAEIVRAKAIVINIKANAEMLRLKRNKFINKITVKPCLIPPWTERGTFLWGIK